MFKYRGSSSVKISKCTTLSQNIDNEGGYYACVGTKYVGTLKFSLNFALNPELL